MSIWNNKTLSNLKGEIWKPIIGFEQTHLVSNYGRVKALARYITSGCVKKPLLRPEKIINQKISLTGYCHIAIQCNKVRKDTNAHRLVAEAFIDNKKNLPEVNHIDGNKANNRVENLEWVTNGDNQRHAFRIGLKKKRFGTNHHNGILSDKDALKIIKEYKKADGFKYKFPLQNKLADRYGITPKHVQQIALGFKRPHLQNI